MSPLDPDGIGPSSAVSLTAHEDTNSKLTELFGPSPFVGTAGSGSNSKQSAKPEPTEWFGPSPFITQRNTREASNAASPLGSDAINAPTADTSNTDEISSATFNIAHSQKTNLLAASLELFQRNHDSPEARECLRFEVANALDADSRDDEINGSDIENDAHDRGDLKTADADESLDALAQDEESEALRSEQIDPSKTQKALDDIRADVERCEGKLTRVDVDRLYLKRGLTPFECAFVERRLQEEKIEIQETDDDDQIDDWGVDGSSGAMLAIWNTARKQRFLSASEERACGRAICLENQAQLIVDSGRQLDAAYLSRVRTEAQKAKHLLVTTNLRWVVSVAARFRFFGAMDPNDLIQEGSLGLMRASEKYDPEMGFRFKTYATWWIRQAISRSIADKARTIRLPVHLIEKIRKLKRAYNRILAETGKEPSYEALGIAIGDTAERAAKLMWFADSSEVTSIEAPITEDFKIEDVISTTNDDTSDGVENNDRRRSLAEALLRLNPREERVIRLRFGINMPSDHTLQEVGNMFGVTRERIRQIEAKALRKMSHPARRLRFLLDSFHSN